MGTVLVCLLVAGMSFSGKPEKGPGIRFKSDEFTMTLFGDFSIGWEYSDAEAAPPVSGFECSRAALYLKLDIPKANTTLFAGFLPAGYTWQIGSKGMVEDLFIEHRPKRFKAYNAAVTVGQMRVPFSLFGLISERALQFLSRAPTIYYFYGNRLLGISRDTGVMVRGDYKNFSLQAGCYNGQGINRTNPDDKYLTVVRLEWAYPRPRRPYAKRYLEAAPVYFEKPFFRLGFAAAYNAAAADFDADDRLEDAKGITFDVEARWRSFSFMGGLIHATFKEGRATLTARAPRYSYGYIAQFIWLFHSRFSLGLRYSYFDPDVHYLHDWQHQEALALNCYLAGMSRIVRFELSRTTTKVAPATDILTWGIALLIQIIF